jgi:uncharacterized protein (DUF1697 family)
MKKLIAILRGINVGGKRKILMADLRSLFENNGFTDVKTYIQSGNVFFSSASKRDLISISNLLEKAILDEYGFTVPVVVVSHQEIERAIKSNPFLLEEDIDIKQLHLTFLKEKPTTENRLNAESYNYEPDKFIIKEKNVFINCIGKYHKTKLSNNFFESKLKVSATTRNWKTVMKLFELSK